MTMEDLLRLRTAFDFSRAIDPPPVADRNFAASVLNRIEDERAALYHPTVAVLMEGIKSFFTPLKIRWLAPAFALLLLFMFPLLGKHPSQQGETPLISPMALKVAQKKDLPPTPDKRKKTGIDDYLRSHAHYAQESDISYPIIYASY